MTDRPLFYLLDEQGNPVPATDNDHAAVDVLLKDIDARRVARTEKTVAERTVVVSTIFLCMDEQYAITLSEDVDVELFQTCVFVGKVTTGFEKYYKTRQDALQGHENVCRDVDFLGDAIVKGRIHWSDLGEKLSQAQALREITEIAQEAGEYD